eukprot:scaffold47267_cov53-Phaeocystis_antarctica.AAC.1
MSTTPSFGGLGRSCGNASGCFWANASAENGIPSAGMRHPPPAVRCRPGKHPTMNLTGSVTMSLQPSESKQM